MDERILKSNRKYLDERASRLEHLRTIQVRKTATFCRDALESLPYRDRDVIGQTVRGAVEDVLADPSLTAALCKEIVLQSPTLSPKDFLPPQTEDEPTPASISYFRNPHSDEAYRIFSSHVDNAVSVYADTSNGCCEDVYTGRAAYCILPVYSSKEGMLSSFCTMVAEYELFAYAIAEVPIPRSDGHTIFGLFKRRCEWNERKTHFAFGISDELLSELGRILCALSSLGAEPVRIGAVPIAEGERTIYPIILNVARANLTAVLLYLEVAVRSYLSFGLFERWSDKESRVRKI